MDIFAQNKLLIRIVIIFAILNAATLTVFVWKQLSHPAPLSRVGATEHRDVGAVLKQELGLSDSQVVQFAKVRAGFLDKEDTLVRSIRAGRDSMNSAMFSARTDDAFVLALAHRIADNEFRMESLRYIQAKELKTLCSPSQLEKFERLVREIRDYLRPDNQGPQQKQPCVDEQRRQNRPPRSDGDRPSRSTRDDANRLRRIDENRPSRNDDNRPPRRDDERRPRRGDERAPRRERTDDEQHPPRSGESQQPRSDDARN